MSSSQFSDQSSTAYIVALFRVNDKGDITVNNVHQVPPRVWSSIPFLAYSEPCSNIGEHPGALPLPCEDEYTFDPTYLQYRVNSDPYGLVIDYQSQVSDPPVSNNHKVPEYIGSDLFFSDISSPNSTQRTPTLPSSTSGSTYDPQPSPPSPGKSRPSKADWAYIRPRLTELYIEHDLPLHVVANKLRDEYGFDVSLNMYKKRLNLWGLKKNMSAAEKLALLGNPTELRLVDRVKRRKVERLARELDRTLSESSPPSLLDVALSHSHGNDPTEDFDAWFARISGTSQSESDDMSALLDHSMGSY